jgi:hypothetical protein
VITIVMALYVAFTFSPVKEQTLKVAPAVNVVECVKSVLGRY